MSAFVNTSRENLIVNFPHSNISAGPRVAQGFTLVELMVVVAIVAIISAVAFPSYQDSVRKGRRADAMAAIAAIQQSQERWRGNNSAYSTSLTQLNVTEPALYSLAVTAPTSTAADLVKGYAVVAEGRGAQANDEQCKRMSVRLLDGNLAYAACASCTTFSYATSHPCFSR